MYKNKLSKHKRIFIIICIIMNCFIMTSCFSYKDIDRVLFVTALMIDVDKDGNPIVYSECFRGMREASEGTEERIVFKGNGKTIFEAVRDMNSLATFKMNYTQNKAIIFTEKAAESGIDDFIDFLDRDQELLVRPYIAVFKGDAESFFTLKFDQEKYIGFLIMRIIENIGASSRAVTNTFNDFYNQRTMGNGAEVVTIIQLKKETLEPPKLQVSGGAVILDDKMVSELTAAEGQGYNFLMNKVSSGTLEITNPCEINKFVTLEILSSKTKTEINYKDNAINLKKKIKVRVNFGEAQKKITLTKDNINKIQETSELNIVKATEAVFNEYKGMGIDIFNIQEEFYMKYPKIKKENYIDITKLEVEVETEIMNTGDVKNFK
ncbi:Ger(x)C family spore germination protein [Clostridium sp.]|jgi:spore germination protein KC|uniref:Ger(x)C family spore germination protein n=1 Tax=Clostridium sp. TaxID=1506 RepID=UPI003EED1432